MSNERPYLDEVGSKEQPLQTALEMPATVPPAPVVCVADERYALPLAVMLESLLAHVRPPLRPIAHIIDCGLSSSSRAAIEGLADGRSGLVWHASRRSAELGDPAWGHVTGATYERLWLGEYLPLDVGEVLWLDCDLLVLDDPGPLLQAEACGEPEGAILHAVRDPFVPRVSAPFGVHDWRRLGLAQETPYFNAGVMRVNLSRWRSMDVAGRAMDYLKTYGRKVYFNEQEALNAVIGAGWAQLDDRWNVSANPIHARRQNPRGGPAIVHFAGRIKPWNVPGLGEFQDAFFRHLDDTPWQGTRPGRTLAKRILAWYVGSDLRRMTYWLENQRLRLLHYWGL